MKQIITLHCIVSFFPSNFYDNNNIEKQQDRPESGVFLVIPLAKRIDIIFFKRVALSSYKCYNHFAVFNNKFKDGFTLTKRLVWIHYPIDPTTKHMQIFNMLKALSFCFFCPPSPKQKNHRNEASVSNQDILLELKNLDSVLGLDSGSLCNLGYVSKLNC